MSACNASRLRAVSLSVSPFVRLEVVAEILITSALRRNAASSKEVRVRVLGSTKKLTSVLPRNAGTFLISRVPIRSEEHTSELQSRFDLVCRLLLEKNIEHYY